VNACGVVNADDPSAEYVAGKTEKPVISFSARGDAADFSAHNILADDRGCLCSIHGPGSRCAPVRINLPGTYNVGNVLAALASVSTALDMPWEQLLPFIPLLKPVHGRMTALRRGQDFEVIIDYAHTPSSFEAVLPSLRSRIVGNIICIFGSGGERDRGKRPLQGAVAEKYCDIIILADEDPRGEDPEAILKEIASGIQGGDNRKPVHLIPDRKKAIRTAFKLASKGDLVLLLGKGHENSIIYADQTMPYDEMAEALDALREMGYSESPVEPYSSKGMESS
jgi:UDP-N-acetylmuramoyl-L-alanyl-D-glutamate--2,6-diaminopimelate ligase